MRSHMLAVVRSEVLVGDVKYLSVFGVLFRPPEVIVDFHHAFSHVLVHLHPLNVNAESVDEDSSEVIQEPGFGVAVCEFEG